MSLTTLQAGRGLAALLVVLFHATVLFAAPKYWGSEIADGIFGFGYAGVEFFFVLSGFIMFHVHRRDIGKPQALPKYALKRVVRIYPAYWIVTFAIFLTYAVTSDARIDSGFNSLVLIGGDTDALVGVAWTLFHEVLFYTLFAFLILQRILGALILIAWSGACLFYIGGIPPHYALSSINLLFGLGIGAAFLAPHIPAPRVVMVTGITSFVAVGLEVVYGNLLTEDWRELAFGVSAAIAIAGSVKAEWAGLIVAPTFLTKLGDSSYALYLLHYPLLSFVAKVWLASPLKQLPPAASFVLLVAICVGAGLAFHSWVEARLLRYLLPKRFRTSKSAVAEPVTDGALVDAQSPQGAGRTPQQGQ